MVTLDAMLKDMPLHQNFYIRGVINSLLPEFLAADDRAITENNISGESIELLRSLVMTLAPNFDDAEEGFVASFGYEDINKKFNLKNLLREEGLDVSTFEKDIKMSFGTFDVFKENGKMVIKDVYDFPAVGEWKEFSDLKTLKDYYNASRQDSAKTPYFAARYYGERNITADDNPLPVRIEIPDQPQVIDIDFDNDVEPTAATFVFEGPMTNLRKKLWDEFTSMFESEPSMPLPKSKPGVQMEMPMSRNAMMQEQQAQQDAMSINDQSA